MVMKISIICLALVFSTFTAGAQKTPAATPMLVTAEWLQKNLAKPDLVLLHVGAKDEYDAGHIAGARYIALADLSLTREESALSLQLAPAERLKAAFERIDVSNSSRIVVYFGKDWVSPTTRVYFTLDYLGLGGNASLLDGGMPAWVAAGGKLTSEVPKVKPGSIKASANDELVAKSDWIRSILDSRGVKVVDARDPQFYSGANAGGQPRAGRIKGACSVPFTSVLDPQTNKFRSAAEIRRIFADAGVGSGDSVVTYCHIGQQATVAYFAAKMAGLKVRLYDGSYQEWSRLADMPVEADSAPQTKPPEKKPQR